MSRRRERRGKELSNKADNFKRDLSRLVPKHKVPQRDSKVKEGLFRKGFRTKHLLRAEGLADAKKFARLNGDLDEIISLVNGEAPSNRYEETRSRNRSLSKSPFFKHGKSPPAPSSNDISSTLKNQDFELLENHTRHPHKFPRGNCKTNSGKENIPVHELNFNSVPNTQAVKKARTAEFINSLPSIFEEDINPSHENAEPKSSNSADDKLREAHMTTCFGELASSIGHSLVILRKKRYGKINYNQDLKQAIMNDYAETCRSSPSTSTYYSEGSIAVKNPSPSANVNFEPRKCVRNYEPMPVSPSIAEPSPLRLSSQTEDPFLQTEGPHLNLSSSSFPNTFTLTENSQLNSHSSSLRQDSRPSSSQLFFPQSYTSLLSNSQLHCSETLTNEWAAPPPPFQNPSVWPPQNSCSFHDYPSETILKQPERPTHKEVNNLSRSSPDQDSLIPKFKFYPRNMY
nr:PREDICTED: uncharacterized protein LOC109030754 isoform X3 [Bemisia tabaci]XP_018897417.1 PREDICTED: uncharacterized protein LOC109030754 isoform X3 [Bemisia tabaci]